MDTRSTLSTSMSIQEAAAHYQVSTKTIRQWIKACRLKASRVNGQWRVYPDMDKTSNLSRQNVYPDVQTVPPTDTATMAQMQSEIDHLREALHKRDTQKLLLTDIIITNTHRKNQVMFDT